MVPGDYHPYPAYAKKQVEKAIRKWGRFTLVEDPEQADLVLVVFEGTKKQTYSYSVEHPKWYEKDRKTETFNSLVDRLLVFKGGKTSKADTTPLWDSGEIEYGSFADVLRLRMPATATAIKFRKFVEALEKGSTNCLRQRRPRPPAQSFRDAASSEFASLASRQLSERKLPAFPCSKSLA